MSELPGSAPARPKARWRAPPFLRGARAAIIFLTRLPVGGFPYAEADFKWSSAWFPFVGLVVGAAQALVIFAVTRAGQLVAAALAVAAGMLVTGAFHEDGLADTADALGGAYDRKRLFEILKDSRVGSFGAGALAMVLILRVALLARLGSGAPAALILTQSLSRLPPVWMMAAMPYVSGEAGAAKSRVVARAGTAQAAVATLWPALVIAAALARGELRPFEAAATLAATAAIALLAAWRFHVRAGGLTGDFLGATQQLSECAALLGLALARGEGTLR